MRPALENERSLLALEACKAAKPTSTFQVQKTEGYQCSLQHKHGSTLKFETHINASNSPHLKLYHTGTHLCGQYSSGKAGNEWEAGVIRSPPVPSAPVSLSISRWRPSMSKPPLNFILDWVDSLWGTRSPSSPPTSLVGFLPFGWRRCHV